MTVLIFGGTGAVGRALAKKLTDAGHSVAVTGRDAAALQEIEEDLGADTYECDVLEDGAVAEVVEAVAKDSTKDGGLTGLVYAVGSIVIKPLKSTTAEDFLNTYRLNTVGAAMAAQAAMPHLKKSQNGKNKGSIVLFSTVAMAQGFANHTAIASAKGGVEGLTRSLAAEFAPDVRVNCVALSLTESKMAAPFTKNETMAKGLAGMHPIPRLGEGADAAAAAAFLLSDEASWITGSILPVDGGRHSLRPKG